MAAAARIRLLVLDVDGVLTDGRLHYDAQGGESKTFHVHDGQGIKAVMAAGITVAVLSGRDSPATTARMRELGVTHVEQGCADKPRALARLLAALDITAADTACIGDDVPDLGILAMAGLSVGVADAHPEVRTAVDWLTTRPGGGGAVRELCDLLLGARHGR